MNSSKRKRNPQGQPTKLTPFMKEEFVKLIGYGTYISDVCNSLGIHHQTYRNWMIWGEEYALAKRPNPKHLIYFEFFEAVNRATARLKLETVGQIRKISLETKDWRGLLAFLERRFPDEWGRRRLEVTGKDGGPIRSLSGNLNLDSMSEDELADAYAQLLREDD